MLDALSVAYAEEEARLHERKNISHVRMRATQTLRKRVIHHMS
jgi:hypothetical protein